jgi:plastocyanin
MWALAGGLGAVCLGARSANAADDKWATVKGQVVFVGANVPARPPLNVNKDQQACLAKGPILSEEVVVNPDNKGVANVFVWITAADGGKPPINPAMAKPDRPTVEIDQPHCAFEPHALAMREGQTLIAKNTAAVAHNVNWQGNPVKNPGGNKIIPPGKDEKISNLKADKRPITVSCNIHPWMKGWIRVYDHPYFAVTDKDGKFEIKGAPVGKYKIWYWSDTGWKGGAAGANGEDVTIKAGGTDLDKVNWK